MAAITVCSDFGTQENKICHCFHFFPLYLPWSGGIRCHDLSFLNVDFQARFFQSPLSHSSRGSLVLPILGLILASCFLLWHVTVCISCILLCSTQPPNQVTWNPEMTIHCMSQFCVCSSSSATLTWAHLYNDAQLANWLESGLPFAADWAEPLGLCLIIFTPDFFTAWGSQGRDPGGEVSSVGALIQPLLALFAAVLLAKADLMAKIRINVEKECHRCGYEEYGK